MDTTKKTSLLVFIVAYNAANKIESVLDRIPSSLQEDFDVCVLVADDCSKDDTANIGAVRS